MDVVKDSPEHHFLTLLEKIRGKEEGWYGMHIALSRKLSHSSLIGDPDTITAKLEATRKDSSDLLQELQEKAAAYKTATLYQFTDSDIMLFVKPLTCPPFGPRERQF